MDDTRSALTEKLEKLEHQVTETVHGASAAVTETIGNVKDAVQETVQTVKDSVQDTVATVKDTLDIKRQVDEHPWTMVAGATALGFLGGYLLNRLTQSSRSRHGFYPPSMAHVPVSSYQPPSMGRGPLEGNGHGTNGASGASATSTGPAAATEPSSILGFISKTFEPEIKELKGLAVGTMLGVVRDLVTDAVPPAMEDKVEEIIDGVTTRLGGQPVKGRILPKAEPAPETAERYATNPMGRGGLGPLGSQSYSPEPP